MVVIKAQEVVGKFQQVEFTEWKDHPVTRDFFKYLTSKKQELMDTWATGGLTGPSIEETVIRNAAAQGATSMIEEILTLDNDSLNEVSR